MIRPIFSEPETLLDRCVFSQNQHTFVPAQLRIRRDAHIEPVSYTHLILYKAHEVLETLTLDKLTAHKKRELAITFGELVYDGQWFSPLRKALSAFVTSTQEHVTGKVRLELYKGNLINAGVWSPYSLYREDIATFAAGGDYKQSDATGFISIYGLPTKVQAIVNNEKEGK